MRVQELDCRCRGFAAFSFERLATVHRAGKHPKREFRIGLGNDTSRDWRQNALLAVNGTTITPTPAYYVFRHLSQYVVPGAQVVSASIADAVAFKNPDGSLVVTTYNSGGANANYVVAIGGKKFQFMMPGQGWATVKYKP